MGVFKRLGDLGLLGVTVSPEYGGSGMDATAACIVHEELSAADPALCLSYLGELEAGLCTCTANVISNLFHQQQVTCSRPINVEYIASYHSREITIFCTMRPRLCGGSRVS